MQPYRNTHRDGVIRPEQAALARVIESRLADVFALMAMFILLQKLLEVGAPGLFKYKFEANVEQSEAQEGSTEQLSSSGTDLLSDLQHQVVTLQEENERLRLQMCDEINLKDASTDLSFDYAEHDSPHEQLDKIKA